MNVGSYWFSDKIVLRMYSATEVGQDHKLYRITARLAQRAGLPMPRVYVIPDASPNAFATGRNPEHAAVAATEGILRLLPDAELEGVIAHELAHVKHRDILISTVAAVIAATIMLLSDSSCSSAEAATIASAAIRPRRWRWSSSRRLRPMLIQMAISRQREFAADRGGAEIVGSPSGLASALRHMETAGRQIPLDANPATAHMFIMKPFTGRGLMNIFSTHPPTEARIRR